MHQAWGIAPRRWPMTRSITTAVLVAGLVLGGSWRAAAATGGGKANFTTEQLQQIVAPVALYPDDVLSQVFMASTYPLEVVEADRYLKAHPELKGDDLAKAVASQDWDDSVKGLTQFPDRSEERRVGKECKARGSRNRIK